MGRKKTENNRKPRNEYVYATTAQQVDQISISMNKNGSIKFGQSMMSVSSVRSYDRTKGPKILSKVPQNADSIHFDTWEALESNYHFVCGVDTNTRLINGKLFSVVGVSTAKHGVLPEREGPRRYWKHDVPFCLEYVGLRCAPENFGWMAALEVLQAEGSIRENTKVGMIVDSDLGNLDSYNTQKMPVCSGQMLPNNVTLIYASSDNKNDSIVNRIIAIADEASSLVLDAIARGSIHPSRNAHGSELFESYRFIEVTAVEGRFAKGDRVVLKP